MFKKNREFAESYKDYYPIVFSAIYTKTGNIDDTEDLCQEIFSRFYEKLEKIENKRKWINGAIRLELLAYYRDKKRKEVDIDEFFQDVTMTYVNGFRDARIIIKDALDNLEEVCEEHERILFDLIAIRNFTYEDAGTQVGFSKRQVRYIYNQTTKKITDYLYSKGLKSLDELL